MKAVLLILIALVFSACATTTSVYSLLDNSRHQVVKVVATNSMGSGFAVNDRCIVTAAHVVGDEKQVSVFTVGSIQHVAQVVASDINADAAVVCAQSTLDIPSVIFAANLPERYESIYTIGFPIRREWFMTIGQWQDDDDYTSIPAAPGNSGGPVFNMHGEVIGLMDAITVYGGSLFPHLSKIVDVNDITHVLDTANVSYRKAKK